MGFTAVGVPPLFSRVFSGFFRFFQNAQKTGEKIIFEGFLFMPNVYVKYYVFARIVNRHGAFKASRKRLRVRIYLMKSKTYRILDKKLDKDTVYDTVLSFFETKAFRINTLVCPGFFEFQCHRLDRV